MDEMSSRDIFAFSYFFDRGLQAGLVSNVSGGLTTVGAFKKAAKKGLFCFLQNTYIICVQLVNVESQRWVSNIGVHGSVSI